MIEAWIAGLAVGYLLGSIPTGLWVGKWRGGGDIRASGSGRTGATNTFRRLGLKWSLLVLAVDAAKGAAPILIIGAAFDSPTGEVLGGLSAIAGHQVPAVRGLPGRARGRDGAGRDAGGAAVRDRLRGRRGRALALAQPGDVALGADGGVRGSGGGGLVRRGRRVAGCLHRLRRGRLAADRDRASGQHRADCGGDGAGVRRSPGGDGLRPCGPSSSARLRGAARSRR